MITRDRHERMSRKAERLEPDPDEGEADLIKSGILGGLGKAMPVDKPIDDDGIDELLDRLERALRVEASGEHKLSNEESTIVANIRSLAAQLSEMNPTAEEQEVIENVDEIVEALANAPDRAEVDKSALAQQLTTPYRQFIERVLAQDRTLKKACKRFEIPLYKSSDYDLELTGDEEKAVRRAERIGRIVGAPRLGSGLRLAFKHARRNAAQTGDIAEAAQIIDSVGWREQRRIARDGAVATRMYARERAQAEAEVEAMLTEGSVRKGTREQARAGSQAIARALFGE